MLNIKTPWILCLVMMISISSISAEIVGANDLSWTLIGTDPQEDIEIIGYTVLVNESSNESPTLNFSKYEYIDLKAAYISHNDTTLFLKIVVYGEIKDSELVTYSWSFKSNDTQWQKKPVLYINGTATFWDWDVKAYHVGGILFLEVPIEYLRNEGCIQEQNIQTVSVGTIKGGNNEDDIALSDYIDNYVKKDYSLQDIHNNPISFYLMLTLVLGGLMVLFVFFIIWIRKSKNEKNKINEEMRK